MATQAIDSWFTKDCVKSQADVSDKVAEISAYYDKHHTVVDSRTCLLWNTLSAISKLEAERLQHKYNVTVKYVTGQPYDSESAMFADIENGILLVSTENTDHPIMSIQDTLNGRVWHDLTHYEIKSNFGFEGEVATYKRQVTHVQWHYPEFVAVAKHTLYLDIVCQVASGLTYQQFPEQKAFYTAINQPSLDF